MLNVDSSTPGAANSANWPHGYGACCCGCGAPTTIITKTNSSQGIKRGEPRRFIHGHRSRLPKNTRQDPAARFWAKVDKRGPEECWPWIGNTNHQGYGRFSVHHGKSVPASRYAYEIAAGKLPDGVLACHSCDSPGCCNPSHIFAGTPADNMKDKVRKGRHSRGTRHAAACRPMTGEGHHNSTITDEQVRAMRDLFDTGRWPIIAIARAFGRSTPAVRGIVKRKTRPL